MRIATSALRRAAIPTPIIMSTGCSQPGHRLHEAPLTLRRHDPRIAAAVVATKPIRLASRSCGARSGFTVTLLNRISV
jgi:hypothetical protein